MKELKLLIFLFTFLAFHSTALAETWDEPWQKEILKKADYFILVKAYSEEGSPIAELEVIKSFGSNTLSGKIKVDGYFMLDLASSSGHGLHLPFEKGTYYYVFLKKNSKGNFSIPTPTSGYAEVDNGKVSATYRHSYHQALIPQETYEKTYGEIWDYTKSGKYKEDGISSFINLYLTKKPAGFADDEIDTFFLQHAALETAFYLDKKIELKTLKPFLEADNFHSNVSALQLLQHDNSQASKEYLFNFIKTDSERNFEKVIAIKSLWAIGDNSFREKLIVLQEKLSDEETGFGGNIMDPRVSTHFPSPNKAVEELRKM